MIGYATLGTNDFEKAVDFYDAVLGEVGAKRIMKNERMAMWGAGPGKPMLAVCIPYDEQSASVGNGTMIALSLDSKEQATKVYDRALAAGGTDEGAPGNRGDTFFGGYFRDLDGNKLVAFCMG